MKNQIYSALLLVMLLFTSCGSTKKMVYFQDTETVQLNETVVNFEPKIQVGDVLSINVSTIEAEAAIPFNLYETPIIGNGVSNAIPLTYLVNAAGEIYFPVIGKLNVEGFTTMEINDKLTTAIEAYIKQPIINIRLTNFRVTIMGEVKNPGTYAVPNERISILEAIGLAGDLTIQGKRKNVTLIREQNEQRQFVNIDLTNKQLFSSPYFYLAQNDVIYVEPNKTRVNASAVGPNTGVIVSSVSILITLLALLIR
jgi:polysaccharide export outer membrane protein